MRGEFYSRPDKACSIAMRKLSRLAGLVIRATMEQVRVPIDELLTVVAGRLGF